MKKYYLITIKETMIVSRMDVWDTYPIDEDVADHFVELVKKYKEKKRDGGWEIPVIVWSMEITAEQYQQLKWLGE